MKTYVALLRGINVGGKNPLPMKELVKMLEHLGAEGVKTYIQSGNVTFRWPANSVTPLASRLSAEIKKRHGFSPLVIILGLADVKKAMANNPFPEGEENPSTLHLAFLVSAPKNPDLKKLESLKTPSERYKLTGRVFYLHAPEGIGRSKLAASSERLLGVPMTDRNWRTVCKIRDMAKE